ncbi:segmentation protein cap'n'collar [Caerostris extrusa]|uniref:Segmentation protein cap'n'collar n=1 Tax=Caerostris extrusa TaxID=172846 RepID=A0AAV4PYG1_CAEEX|nr:segmentation protein cap'n'collar [Caerostris extrusa]
MHIKNNSVEVIVDCPVQVGHDLIEILWKQDIDLGVSRDAYEFESRQNPELEKLKDVEIVKEKDLFNQSESDELCEDESASPVPDLLAGLNYTIDSETGEYVIEEKSEHAEDDIHKDVLKKDVLLENGLLEENETIGALSHDSYLPFDENDIFSDLTDIFSSAELSNFLNVNLSSDSNYLSQIEDLERELEQFQNFNDTDGNNPQYMDKIIVLQIAARVDENHNYCHKSLLSIVLRKPIRVLRSRLAQHDKTEICPQGRFGSYSKSTNYCSEFRVCEMLPVSFLAVR